MLKRLTTATPVCFEFNGRPVTANIGDSVASALIASGHLSLRQTPVSNSPRGPFCMMGACFECIVEHNGKTVQACMLAVEQNMSIKSLPAAREAIALPGSDD